METLVTCPTCNTPNFTERGLKAHRCKGAKTSALSPQPSAFSSSEPGGRNGGEQLQPATAAPGTLSDSDLGAQLTAQYKRAVSGMREVLIFGAMLMQVETACVRVRTQAGTFDDKGSGLKGWLEKNAPEISRPTAYRFLGITKSIAEEYEAIVGSQIAGRYDLPTLVCADPATLSEKARLKQGELFDYVSGTSQRSWLDQFKPDPYAGNGGKRTRPNGTKRRSGPEKEFDDALDEAMDWYRFGFLNIKEAHLYKNRRWEVLPEVELANVTDLVKTFAKKLDDICRVRGIVPSKIRDWDKKLTPADLGLEDGQ